MSLDKRISAELKRRGRNAKTVAELGLKGRKDPALLEQLHNMDPGCILVTGDDAMPATHRTDLAKYKTTVAVVLPWTPETPLSESQWEHEIVQKWAHLMEEHPAGSVFRYSFATRRRWTLRERAPRMA